MFELITVFLFGLLLGVIIGMIRMSFYFKKKDLVLPPLDVPDKYQPYDGVSLDRNYPDKGGD